MARKHQKMNEPLPKSPLSLIYVLALLAVSALLGFLALKGPLSVGRMQVLDLPLGIIACVMILAGMVIWWRALFKSHVYECADRGEFVTTNVYGYVRNPILSGITFVCGGVMLMCGNAFLIAAPVLFWGMETLAIKNGEEALLRVRLGGPYEEYCQKVNRCIPWIPHGVEKESPARLAALEAERKAQEAKKAAANPANA